MDAIAELSDGMALDRFPGSWRLCIANGEGSFPRDCFEVIRLLESRVTKSVLDWEYPGGSFPCAHGWPQFSEGVHS